MKNRKGAKNPMFGKNHSASAKEAVAKARKNTKWIYEPTSKTQKAVKEEDLEKFLKKGWKLGRPKKDFEPDFIRTYDI